MGITEAEEALFERWSEGRDNFFVKDGVVDAPAFEMTSPSVLFLLKEVNDPGPDGGGWDLREFLRDGARAATWNNVCRWLRGINNLPRDTPWAELANVTAADRSETLANIGAMNLKKSPGGHTIVVSSFWQAATEDAPFLREQFSLYSADLVICCGSVVSGAFDAFMKPESASEWKATTRGIEFLEYTSGKYVIDYSHPEARVSPNLLHYGLVDAVRELRNAV